MATVVAIVLGAFAWTQQARANDLEAARLDRQAAMLVASDMTLALLAYDHDALEDNRERVLALSTPRFVENYLNAFDDGLSGLLQSVEATATAEVRQVMIDVTGDNARAIVVADSTVQSAVGSRQLTGSYLDILLVRVDDQWLVDAVTSVAATGEDILPTADDGP